jgi:Fe-S cluster assembly protein SufD
VSAGSLTTTSAPGANDAPSAAWAPELRAAGAARFADVGFPTTKLEDWRFTPVKAIAEATYGAAPADAISLDDLAPYLFGRHDWARLVFVNGHLSTELSHLVDLPTGVSVSELSEAWASGPAVVRADLGKHATVDVTPFSALNAAHAQDGAFIYVAANVEAVQPVHVVFVTTAAAATSGMHPRHLIVVERGARAAVIESYVTLADGNASFTNPVCEVVVGANAWVEHVRIQRDAITANHVGLTVVQQDRDSHYRSFSLAMGGAIARHDLVVRLGAPNTEALMYGLYTGHGDQLIDNHTTIQHDHPNCRSWEVYKGVLDDRSRGVFNGKILVSQIAQKTDAKQTNRVLLLSDEASIDTKPQLEIFADDVKCTHGATVGFLDDSMRFYLQSRGIPAAAVDQLLTYAFAAEIVAEVAIEAVRVELDRLVRARIGVA